MDNTTTVQKSKNASRWLPVGIVVLLVVLVGGLSYWQRHRVGSQQIQIGVITDLSGPAAYWGESTRVGAEIAKKELVADGYKVNLVYEDYQLDAAKALTAAQKLINIDNVDAVYAEFNPAAISVNSFLKDQNTLFVYDAAVASPLKVNPNAYKTYLDYQAGCKQIAQRFKNQGIEKVGILKVNLEFGELCQSGLKEIYPDTLYTESYNLGDTDFKTQVLKLKNDGVGAVINTGFEGDTLNTLKALKELQMSVPYGTVDDTITDNVKSKYLNELKGTWTFGFRNVDQGFIGKTQAETPKKLATYYAAALAYTHVRQIVKSLDTCKKDLVCTKNALDKATADETIGFRSFQNRVADLEMAVKQY